MLAAFASQGLVFVGLSTRLPTVGERWGLDELRISLLLLMMILLAGVGSVAAERLSRLRDSATVLRLGLLLTVLAVPMLTLAVQQWMLVAAMALYGLALGVVDAGTNMQAVALEHRFGRSILPSFHGAWTAGAVLGAALTLLTASLPLGWAALLAVVPAVVATAPFLPRDDGSAATDTRLEVPWRPIVLVGCGLVVFYLVDTAAQTWGAQYLRHVFDTPNALVGWSPRRRSPTCWPAWWCGARAIGWSAATARSPCSGSVRWSAPSA